MNVATESPVRWPAPPFCQFKGDPPGGCGCLIELGDGTLVEGTLARFDSEGGVLELRAEGGEPARTIAFAQIQRVRLAGHVAIGPDSLALQAVGAGPESADEARDFVVRVRGGPTFKGRTRGFVKDASGLFLFPVEGDSPGPARWFLPVAALEDVQIGPLIGEAIAARTSLSRPALDAALARQAGLREQRLGEYLNDRAIVTREELARALERQREQPSARLGELLLDSGLITQPQLDQALAAQAGNRQRRLGEILVDLGAVTRRQIQAALADKLGIPLINVRDFRIEPDVLDLVKPAFARRHGVLALARAGNSLVVAVENPLANDFVQPLRFATGLAVVPVMADPDDLRLRIAREYTAIENRLPSFNWDQAESPAEGEGEKEPGGGETKVEDLALQLTLEAPRPLEFAPAGEHEARINDSTLVRLVNKMIVDAHAQGVSDIHIESNPGRRNLRVRFRLDGRLRDYLELEPAYRNALVSRIKIMASLDISEHRRAQDGKIDFARYGPLPVELRVAIIPTANGLEDIVLRILAAAEPIPIDALALSPRNLAGLKTMVKRSYGLILVCGPTGSGKTTTLHSVLGHINDPEVKIWTAEDPIEITQAGMRQVQMNPKIGWTFATAMRAFLRADPDVIMVGEMRDEETCKIGIEASLTGHLVFSTLHTNGAAESVVRLLDLGMDPFNFADALIGVLSQRLARRLCPKCRRPHEATPAELAELAEEFCLGTPLAPDAVAAGWRNEYGKGGPVVLHEAVGCDQCREGYKGRIGVHELLDASPRIKTLIHARATAPQIAEAAQQEGMALLRQDAIAKVLAGLVDLASARAAAS